jgi:hypothetical protein
MPVGGFAVPTLDDLLRNKDLRTTEDSMAGEAAELILGVLLEAPRDSAGNYFSAAAILDICRARSTGELRTVFEKWTPALMMHCIELIKEAAEEIAGREDQPEPTANERTPQVSPQSPLAKAMLRRKR